MDRYHFNLSGGAVEAKDPDGQIVKDDAAAIDVAKEGARCMMSADVKDGHLDLNEHIDIVAPRHRPVATVAFSDAVEIEQRRRPYVRRVDSDVVMGWD